MQNNTKNEEVEQGQKGKFSVFSWNFLLILDIYFCYLRPFILVTCEMCSNLKTTIKITWRAWFSINRLYCRNLTQHHSVWISVNFIFVVVGYDAFVEMYRYLLVDTSEVITTIEMLCAFYDFCLRLFLLSLVILFFYISFSRV